MNNPSSKKHFKAYDKEFAERNKNRRVDIINIFFLIAGILLFIFMVIMAIPKPFLNTMVTSGKEMGGMCYVNAKDLAVIIGAELYMERVMNLILYKAVASKAVAVVFALTFGFLASDYIYHLYKTFYAIPKGLITSDHAEYHNKPILTTPRALALYLILTGVLLGTAVSANNMSVNIIDIQQNRHTLIRENFILNSEDSTKSGIRDGIQEELKMCVYNPNITVIEGKSYYQKK